MLELLNFLKGIPDDFRVEIVRKEGIKHSFEFNTISIQVKNVFFPSEMYEKLIDITCIDRGNFSTEDIIIFAIEEGMHAFELKKMGEL